MSAQTTVSIAQQQSLIEEAVRDTLQKLQQQRSSNSSSANNMLADSTKIAAAVAKATAEAAAATPSSAAASAAAAPAPASSMASAAAAAAAAVFRMFSFTATPAPVPAPAQPLDAAEAAVAAAATGVTVEEVCGANACDELVVVQEDDGDVMQAQMAEDRGRDVSVSRASTASASSRRRHVEPAAVTVCVDDDAANAQEEEEEMPAPQQQQQRRGSLSRSQTTHVHPAPATLVAAATRAFSWITGTASSAGAANEDLSPNNFASAMGAPAKRLVATGAQKQPQAESAATATAHAHASSQMAANARAALATAERKVQRARVRWVSALVVSVLAFIAVDVYGLLAAPLPSTADVYLIAGWSAHWFGLLLVMIEVGLAIARRSPYSGGQLTLAVVGLAMLVGGMVSLTKHFGAAAVLSTPFTSPATGVVQLLWVLSLLQFALVATLAYVTPYGAAEYAAVKAVAIVARYNETNAQATARIRQLETRNSELTSQLLRMASALNAHMLQQKTVSAAASPAPLVPPTVQIPEPQQAVIETPQLEAEQPQQPQQQQVVLHTQRRASSSRHVSALMMQPHAPLAPAPEDEEADARAEQQPHRVSGGHARAHSAEMSPQSVAAAMVSPTAPATPAAKDPLPGAAAAAVTPTPALVSALSPKAAAGAAAGLLLSPTVSGTMTPSQKRQREAAPQPQQSPSSSSNVERSVTRVSLTSQQSPLQLLPVAGVRVKLHPKKVSPQKPTEHQQQPDAKKAMPFEARVMAPGVLVV